MQIRVKFTHLEATEAITDYIQEKMDMLDKFLSKVQVINCDVEVEKTIGSQNKGEIFRAEVNLQLPHDLLRVEKTERDLYKAIDKVKDHLKNIIIKHKEKNSRAERVHHALKQES